MATGIEVAGVVLAVLPLFISALEHYSDGMDPIRAFWEYESQLPNQIRKLRDQHINYNLTMRLLLSSIAEADEVDKMISDPVGGSWRDKSIQRRLEERLDETYQAYLDTITHIEEIMKNIAKYLKIDQIDRTSRADLQLLLQTAPLKNGRFEFVRRVKFSMKLRKLKALLDELGCENRELERFTDKTERLEPYRRAKATLIFNPPLGEIRSYAKNLYRVLCVGAGCSQPGHQAKLQLEKRLYPKRTKSALKHSKDINQNSRPCFKVSLYASQWQDVEVQILESDSSLWGQDAKQSRQNQQPPELLSNPEYPKESIALSLVTGKKGVVLIEKNHEHIGKLPGLHAIFEKTLKPSQKVPEYSMIMSRSIGPIVNKCIDKVQNTTVPSKPNITTATNSMSKAVGWVMSESSTMAMNDLSTKSSNSLQEVVDICTAIRKSRTKKVCLGLCLDLSGTLRRAPSIPQQEKQSDGKSAEEFPRSYEGTSLNKLLIAEPNHYGHALSRKERMSLALILASSFVQLEATQWIQDSWGKEDIVFDQSPDAVEDDSIDISKPYILQSLDKQVTENSPKSIQGLENYSLLNLGVVLLELSTGQSFEQYQSRTKGKCATPMGTPEESVKRLMKLSDASKWLKAVQDDLSSGFYGAIRHCIRSYFDETSGKDEALYRQAVLDQVVLPLQEDLQSFLGTRAI